MKVRTSFFVYVAALTGWIGWFIFVIFGGIGMASLPFDLIYKYINRPILLTPKQVETTKLELQLKTKELIKIGNDLKNGREAFAKDKKDWRTRNKVRIKQIPPSLFLVFHYYVLLCFLSLSPRFFKIYS